jgi:hypothetical protein
LRAELCHRIADIGVFVVVGMGCLLGHSIKATGFWLRNRRELPMLNCYSL